MSTSLLPFFPPNMFEEERLAILDVVREVGLDSRQKFILGERVEQLEQRVRQATGAPYVIACASGTGGLALAVQSLGIGSGDEVIVPAFCCQPVASTVINAGAKPVFVDIDEETLVMDPDEVEASISPATRAVMPAHVFSVMADMPAIGEIANAQGLRVIEDAAVAQGASLRGRPAGMWGDAGVFSFFQVKALGAIGEGGVVLTEDSEVADSCRMLRNHGQTDSQRGVHHAIGQNNRMDEILAAFQLRRYDGLDRRLARRAEIAAYYTECFESLREYSLVPPPAGHDGRCYYVYSVLTDAREELRLHLSECGIGTHVYYPLPLPAQPGFRAHAGARSFPRAAAAGRRNLALPIYPHLSDAEVERIADTVVRFFESRQRLAS
ncbi:MAG: DegT/DnrJ/EryC1/StrS family aminotransferase [Solirubrobacterales bacterium]